MAGRRRTPSETRWPDTPEFEEIAQSWNAQAVTLLLGFIWQGYHWLTLTTLGRIDWSAAQDDIERSITQLLEGHIQDAMSRLEPFRVQHGPYEHETRLPAPAQPPQYDIAFVLRGNPRVMWPIEAKVLHSDRDVSPYIADIREQFLTCRYAPFSAGGAMLGYLLKGDPDRVFECVEAGLPCALEPCPDFPDYPHRVSRHVRNVPERKRYPRDFSCHHIILPLVVVPPPQRRSPID